MSIINWRNIMSKLKWDGDVEEDDGVNEDAMPGDDELIDVTEDSSLDENEEGPELPEPDSPEDPDDCEHPWGDVSNETMKRVVRGSTIDTKDIYWCNRCRSILDVVE